MKEGTYVVAGLLLLTALYFGSYFAMIQPKLTYSDADGFSRPSYRFGEETAEFFYHPAYVVDRQVRPERWPKIVAPKIVPIPPVMRP